MSENSQHDKKKGNGGEPAFSVVDRRPAFSGDAPDTEPRYPSVVEELKARAEDAERRAREISAAYRRIDEERDAFRERLARDLERRVDIERAGLLRKILGVLDDLDRALAAGETAADAGSLLSGVTLIRDHLLRILASEGVETLNLKGKRFDPAVAEAISTEETDDPEADNLILEEAGRGFMLGSTLLRPARVRVARSRVPASQGRHEDRREERAAGTRPPDAPTE